MCDERLSPAEVHSLLRCLDAGIGAIGVVASRNTSPERMRPVLAAVRARRAR